MAEINKNGNIIANCPSCNGALTTFQFSSKEFVVTKIRRPYSRSLEPDVDLQHRLFICNSCGSGAIGRVLMMHAGGKYPGDINELVYFSPETTELLPLPNSTPHEIAKEFREAEFCLGYKCFRASAALFRSTLEKTLRENGYDDKVGNLRTRIDEAANDHLITNSRKQLAHEEIRVLGNDVLHDDWREITREEVNAARLYCQRIIEDFYSDRKTVESILREKKRIS